MMMTGRGAWLLLALAACAERGDAEKTAGRADSAPSAPPPAAAAEVPFAAAPDVERGRFASAVQVLPVAPPAGTARFCHWGEGNAGFGLVLKTEEGYAIEAYRQAGPPAAGAYPLKAQNPVIEEFSTYDGFYLSDGRDGAVPLAVMPGGEVVVDSAGEAVVSGTLRLRLRTHLHSGAATPAAQAPGGHDPRETVGTIAAAFRAVEAGSCDRIHEEMLADTPAALRGR